MLRRVGPVPVAVAILVVTVLGQSAAAAWSSQGTGDGRAGVVTMTTVGPVAAVCAGGSSVTVSWAATPLATAYVVERSVDLGPWSVVHGPAAGTTFSDTGTGLLNVSIRWRVTGVRDTWTAAPSSPSPARVISSLGLCA